ncbi:YncE family protein [Fodinibius salsisoli]|uniref:PD40 domain-containing protein n=1 Tax=Fodinibius salsisoli TaxID=2820877 RepID=A0ABT3PN28_9BACT|nr:YncE family protein [Fodinibius salsisoli]MCW9706554.1 PD40 domain-containing protein [Fodinibius salsisoli]
MKDLIHTTIRFISAIAILLLVGTSTVLGQKHQRIYVCNQGEATLSVIDTQGNEILDTIDLQELGFSAKAKPHHTIAEPDGSYWYVTLIGANRVLKFNRDNELVGQTEMEVPGLLTLHPTRDLLLVGRSMSAVNPPQSIGIIKRSDMTLQQELPTFFPRPHAIASGPSGDWSFIASLAQNQMLSVDMESYETNLTRFLGQTHVFVDFAIAPDGETMVVTTQVTGKALVMDISNPASPTVIDTIDVNAQPWHPVFSPDGQYVYFGNKEAHTVTVLDMKSRTVDAVIEGEGLAQPHGSALSADGKYLYISNNNRKGTYKASGMAKNGEPRGTVTVINTQTREIEKIIEVGSYTTGIGTRAW